MRTYSGFKTKNVYISLSGPNYPKPCVWGGNELSHLCKNGFKFEQLVKVETICIDKNQYIGLYKNIGFDDVTLIHIDDLTDEDLKSIWYNVKKMDMVL